MTEYEFKKDNFDFLLHQPWKYTTKHNLNLILKYPPFQIDENMNDQEVETELANVEALTLRK